MIYAAPPHHEKEHDLQMMQEMLVDMLEIVEKGWDYWS